MLAVTFAPVGAASASLENAEAAQVPPVKSSRADGLRIVTESHAGQAVSARLFLSFHGTPPTRPYPGIAPVVAHAALHSGKPAQTFGTTGAAVKVGLGDNAILWGVDTTLQRWTEDVSALLMAVSQPAISEASVRAARVRATPFGERWSLEDIFSSMQLRLMPHDVALDLPDADVIRVTMDAAVHHIEETWSSDRMTLVVVGNVPRERVMELVDTLFLVPASAPLSAPSGEEAPLGSVADDMVGTPPSFVAYGQWARAIPPAEGLVLAEFIRMQLHKAPPQAGECDVRYFPSVREPVVLTACAAVEGTALDVREDLRAILGEATARNASPAEMAHAKHTVQARLRGNHAASAVLAERMLQWAAAELQGGTPLENAVAATHEDALVRSLKVLLEPGRHVRLHRTAKAE
jgi:hypothetical protein